MKCNFSEMVTIIKRACRWTEELAAESALKTLLEWRGCTKTEDSMQQAWEKFLDAYYEIDEHVARGHDAEIKLLVRRFIRQSAFLTSAVLNFDPNVTFIGFDEHRNRTVICVPPSMGTEFSHLHLMSTVHYLLDSWTCYFGNTDVLRSQYGFGQFERQCPAPLSDPSTFFGPGTSTEGKRSSSASGPQNQRNNGKKIFRSLGQRKNFSQGKDRNNSSSTSSPLAPVAGDKTAANRKNTQESTKSEVNKTNENNTPAPRTKKLLSIASSLMSPANNAKIFGLYSEQTHYSSDSRLVSVLFDTGNEAPTIFPNRLLPFSPDAKPSLERIPCAGRSNNFIETTHSGSLHFIAPLDNGESCEVVLQGLFASPDDSSDDEIIVSRHELPIAPGLNQGINFPVTVSLKRHPTHLLGLDERLRQVWNVILVHNTALRRVRGSDMTWTDKKAILDLSEDIELDLGPFKEYCSAERLIWKIHNR